MTTASAKSKMPKPPAPLAPVQAPSPRFFRPLPVQPLVRFYPKGTNTTPCIGFVFKFSRETAELVGLLPNGRTLPRSGVRHIDDPYLVKHPDAARENGCWDYWPGTEPEVVKQLRAGNLHDEDMMLWQIDELAKAGHNDREIAATLAGMTNFSWSPQLVASFRKRGEQERAEKEKAAKEANG